MWTVQRGDLHITSNVERANTDNQKYIAYGGDLSLAAVAGGRVGDGQPSLAQPIIYSPARAPPQLPGAASALLSDVLSPPPARAHRVGPSAFVIPRRHRSSFQLFWLSSPSSPRRHIRPATSILRTPAPLDVPHNARRTYAARRDCRAPPWLALPRLSASVALTRRAVRSGLFDV